MKRSVSSILPNHLFNSSIYLIFQFYICSFFLFDTERVVPQAEEFSSRIQSLASQGSSAADRDIMSPKFWLTWLLLIQLVLIQSFLHTLFSVSYMRLSNAEYIINQAFRSWIFIVIHKHAFSAHSLSVMYEMQLYLFRWYFDLPRILKEKKWWQVTPCPRPLSEGRNRYSFNLFFKDIQIKLCDWSRNWWEKEVQEL